MPGTAQNWQKRLIFIVVPQARKKMTEKGKQEKKENEYVKEKYTNMYMHMYIYTHTHTDIQTYIY